MTKNLATNVLETLEAEGLLKDRQAAEGLLNPAKTVWFLETSLVLAAFIAALFFMGFVSMLGMINSSDGNWLVLGFVFLVISLVLYRLQSHRFVAYLALAINLGGLGMALTGCAMVTQSFGMMVLFNGLLCLALFFFPAKLLRLLWFLVFFGNAIAWLSQEGGSLGLPMAALVAMCASVFLFANPRGFYGLRPLAYALALAAVGATALSLMPQEFWSDRNPFHWWLTKAGMGLVLGIYIWHKQGRQGMTPQLIAVFVGIALTALLTSPALLTALVLLTVSFTTRESWLFGFAAVAFACALWFFYYYMDVSLLLKSGYLTAVGAALLLLRRVLRRIQVSITREAVNGT